MGACFVVLMQQGKTKQKKQAQSALTDQTMLNTVNTKTMFLRFLR